MAVTIEELAASNLLVEFRAKPILMNSVTDDCPGL